MSLLKYESLFINGDILIIETKIRRAKFPLLRSLLNQMKVGSRLLMYEDLSNIYREYRERVSSTDADGHGIANKKGKELITLPCPFEPLNKRDDRFACSWSPNHMFFLYTKIK